MGVVGRCEDEDMPRVWTPSDTDRSTRSERNMGVKSIMKYVCMALPMLFGIEVLSWFCLLTIAVVGICELALKIDEEKNDKW